MAPIVALEDALAYVGVAVDAPEAAAVSGMLDAISDEIRDLANAPLEGDAGTYDEVIRVNRLQEFYLTKAPVDPDQAITITPVLFDGTTLTELESTQWRLEDASTGRIRIIATRPSEFGDPVQSRYGLKPRFDAAPEYVRATWTTTGTVSARLRLAALEWLKERWTNPLPPAHLAGYATGKDAETYFPNMIGHMPAAVSRAILGAWRPSNGGVI